MHLKERLGEMLARPIETSRDLLEVAGVSEEEARTLALDSARGRAPEADSMPVHTF